MRGRWGAFAALLALASAMPSCQDGYPIAATPCDRYCDLGIQTDCGGDSPAGCVASCESSPVIQLQDCSSEFDDWVLCHKVHHHGLTCGYEPPLTTTGCEASAQAYGACADAHRLHVPRDAG